MTTIEIWHNPACSKSRKALELLTQSGRDVEVVLYLESPPSAARIAEVLDLLGVEPRALVRTGEAAYTELGLANPTLDRATIIDALAKHPVLIERPVVITDRGAVIGRPPERVQDLL